MEEVPGRRLDDTGRAWFDATLVVVLLLMQVAAATISPNPAATVLGFLEIAPLFWRRRHPVPVFGVVALASAVQVGVTDIPIWGQVAFPIALYSLARFSTAWIGFAGFLVGGVACVIAAVDWSGGLYSSYYSLSAVLPVFLTLGAITLAAWALGALGRTRDALVASLVERGDRIARDAEQRVALAASDERARIAREMHDVVAHGLSVIVVQADGARYAAESDPTDLTVAPATLERIAATGREALADMRRLLGLLRDGESGTAPLPGLADLPALVAEAGAEGRLEAVDRPVGDALALTAYRVVQEALTNVRRHAGPGAHAVVTVRVEPGSGAQRSALVVAVEDDGRGAAAAGSDTGGHGLVGMRERVAVHGGDVEAGPRPGGGWLVVARLPL